MATGELCSDSLSGCTCYPRGKPLIEGNADGLPALPITAVGRLCFPWLELCVSVHYFSPSASLSPCGAFSCSTMKSNKQEECTRIGTDHLGLAVGGGRSTYASSSDKVHSARHKQLSVTAYVEEQLRSIGTGLQKHLFIVHNFKVNVKNMVMIFPLYYKN